MVKRSREEEGRRRSGRGGGWCGRGRKGGEGHKAHTSSLEVASRFRHLDQISITVSRYQRLL